MKIRITPIVWNTVRVAALVCLCPILSSAQEGPPAGSFIERLDKNGDGKVSKEEFDGPAEHFAHFDRDGDGAISEDEAPKGPPPPRGHGEGPPQGGSFIERLDKNGDGKVSKEEFDGPAEHFAHFDRDGDGAITEDEAPKGPPPPRGRDRGRNPGGR